MHIEFKVVFQQHRVRDSARGPVRFMPSPGELETNNTCVCPDINNAGELPFLKPSECPDQIPSAEENLIFFFIYTHTHTHTHRGLSLLSTTTLLDIFLWHQIIHLSNCLSKSTLFALFYHPE